MKDSLLKIAKYLEAMEKRLAAVEARLAENEAKLAETEKRFAEMGQHVAELEARPIPEDSEIEMDWIEEEPETPEEPAVIEEEKPAAAEEKAPTAEPETPQEPKQPETPQEPNLFAVPKEELEKQEPAAPRGTVATPVADLKHAISLGDRFLFQRELFSQNGELMQKTLEALNGMPNIDGALAYLDKHFDWDKESPTFALFLNALHRRFG